jgi:dihydroflavonol-4-reductase
MTAVLVTGATGFLGTEIVRELLRRGHRVHAMARASSDRSVLEGAAVRWHDGDLLAPGEVESAFLEFRREVGDEPSVVVHSAAVISYRTGDRELQEAANVEGTRTVLDAARRHEVGRVVHVSSVVALGFVLDAESELDEDAPFNGDALSNDYVDTKRAAEVLALEASDADLEVVVASPGAVFGRTTRTTNTGRFLRTLARHPLSGLVAPPGGISVVGVEDVARGVALALEKGRAGRRFLLCESNVRLADLYARVFAELGRGRVLFRLPRVLWSVVVAVATLVDRIRRTELATPQALRLLGVHFRARADRARSELGWDPVPFESVLVGVLEDVRAERD